MNEFGHAGAMLPMGLWSAQVVGQYLRPDGTPHRGYVILRPDPDPTTVQSTVDGVPVTMVLQAARLDLDENGCVACELLNPNDPSIRPGPSFGSAWCYRVYETFQMGPTLGWFLDFPEDIGDGDFLDLSKVPRRDEEIIRPTDWFPRHLIDTPVQASRISPRNGPLLRKFPESYS